jgi:aconitate hydratase
MSPPLVVAYALAGTIDVDIASDPIGVAADGGHVFLKDLWPSQQEIADLIAANVTSDMFAKSYASVYDGDDKWRAIPVAGGGRYLWDKDSTYVKEAPYFEDMAPEPSTKMEDLTGLVCLAKLGDSVTTDHISPAGSIKLDSPAGHYLTEHEVRPHLFNSYGSRRGNHEVIIRGTFANVRLRNQLAPGTEGGLTTCPPGGPQTTIFEAAEKYRSEGTGLVVIAGKEYGTGSSRDWAAKGTLLLGVRAVLAESFERIHRSNLIGMGVLPLQFVDGEGAESLGLTGLERYDLRGMADALATGLVADRRLEVVAASEDGAVKKFQVRVRIDTPMEAEYYRHGGILQYVLRQLLKS